MGRNLCQQKCNWNCSGCIGLNIDFWSVQFCSGILKVCLQSCRWIMSMRRRVRTSFLLVSALLCVADECNSRSVGPKPPRTSADSVLFCFNIIVMWGGIASSTHQPPLLSRLGTGIVNLKETLWQTYFIYLFIISFLKFFLNILFLFLYFNIIHFYVKYL